MLKRYIKKLYSNYIVVRIRILNFIIVTTTLLTFKNKLEKRHIIMIIMVNTIVSNCVQNRNHYEDYLNVLRLIVLLS